MGKFVYRAEIIIAQMYILGWKKKNNMKEVTNFYFTNSIYFQYLIWQSTILTMCLFGKNQYSKEIPSISSIIAASSTLTFANNAFK